MAMSAREVSQRPDELAPARLDTVAEVACLLGRSDRILLLAGGAVCGVAVGVPLRAHTLRPALAAGAFGWFTTGLLVLVVAALVRAAVLLALAHRPVLTALGELRRVLGAPVDPAVPWTPREPAEPFTADLARHQLLVLTATARVRHSIACRALAWAMVSGIGFVFWSLSTAALAAGS